MEPRGKADTGRRQFLCGCCATLTSVGLGPRFAAAATDPVVVPVESAPFHFRYLKTIMSDFSTFLSHPARWAPIIGIQSILHK